MTFGSFIQRPALAAMRCALVAIISVALLLWLDWEVVPKIIGAAYNVPFEVPDNYPNRAWRLALDVLACFVVATLLMRAARSLAGQYGLVASALMALCGWCVYFQEVGYFSGMLYSEYGLWYEIPSFLKYWIAYWVSQLLWRGDASR